VVRPSVLLLLESAELTPETTAPVDVKEDYWRGIGQPQCTMYLNVKFTLEQVMKVQRRITGIALLFL
jgi:hypothetical protein